MADHNLLDFEIYLGISHGRWDGEEPRKPQSPREMEKLRDEAERAEWLRDHMWNPDRFDQRKIEDAEDYENDIFDRFRDAELAYLRAVNERDLYERVKAIRRKTPPRAEDAFALKGAMYDARARSDVLHGLGDDFSSRRERIDADCAACQAEDLFEIAQAKYQDAARQARDDHRKGIVRRRSNSNIIRL